MTEQELLAIAVRKCRRVDLYTDPRPFTAEEQIQYDQLSRRRANGEPLQYCLGETDFFGLPFKVDSRVLIPRPETELLVEAVLQFAKENFTAPICILDLGTGSGNIAITLAASLVDCRVVAVDISEEALVVARSNAVLNQVYDRIDFVKADMQEFLNNHSGPERLFDIIVSNPPYIPTSQLANLPADVQREPRKALDGGADGLNFLNLILSASGSKLKSGGGLFLEIGDGQERQLEKVLKAFPFLKEYRFIKDYTNVERIIAARANCFVR